MDSFFGIGLPELVLILVIAGVVMGPERIAHIARWLGKTTAQLQSISRAFVQQLHNEIDGIDDGEALKSAMTEMQSLRKELESLKSEFVASTTIDLPKEEKKLPNEVSNSILPPNVTASGTTTNGHGKHTAVSPDTPKPSTPANLPTPLEIKDDPE